MLKKLTYDYPKTTNQIELRSYGNTIVMININKIIDKRGIWRRQYEPQGHAEGVSKLYVWAE